MVAKRHVSGRSEGFFVELSVFEEEEECLKVDDGEMEEGVFRVERIVERRRKKVKFCEHYYNYNVYKLLL